MRRPLALLPLLVTALLAACSTAPAGPVVASLPPSAAPSASPAAPPAAGSSAAPAAPAPSDPAASNRPQLRLDDAPERVQALWNAYDQCLLDHGAQADTARAAAASADGSGATALVVQDPVPAAAVAACQDRLPQQPPELDPAVNAHYHDDYVAWVDCIKAHGVGIHLTTDDNGDLGWTYDSATTPIPADLGTIQDDCERAAFGGGK